MTQIRSLGQQINRLLISLLLVILMGITNTLPAYAQVKSAAKTPIFNPEEVRLGITPTGWSNSDDLTMDLNPPISYKQIISEIALAGFKGLQGAPKFPKDTAQLKKDLEIRGLTISEPWVGTF
ncbi:MAG: myo-inosose-2 dehydratase, partial [Dolichospermum sp.]